MPAIIHFNISLSGRQVVSGLAVIGNGISVVFIHKIIALTSS